MIVSPEVKSLIPDDLIKEAEKCGVERISVSSWLYAIRRLFGFWHPESKEILIDLTKGDRLLELYQKKYPELNVQDESEAFLILFYHEISHVKGYLNEQDAEEHGVKLFRERRDATKKKVIETIQEGIKEGFRTRTV